MQARASVLRTLSSGAVGALVASAFISLLPTGGANADAFSEVLTASAKTITSAANDANYATAPFKDLSITVSQTDNLVSQAVSIKYSGLASSRRPTPGTDGGSNFLQVAQCWGEDPNNPGHPDRTTCQYGTVNNPASVRDGFLSTDAVKPQDADISFEYNSQAKTSYVSVPFRAVTGEEVNSIKLNDSGDRFWDQSVNMNQNQFFTPLNTNFLPWTGSDETGAGLAKFEIQTVMQSPGLGCGTPVVTGNVAVGQSCWLVFIPRATSDNAQPYITKSGLFWDSWQHNVAVKLDFKPVGVRCAIGSAEKQLSGSELIGGAIASWQPKLCEGAAGSAFVLSTGNEQDSLASLMTNPTAPLAFTSEPYASDVENKLLYAPIAMSGVVVSCAIDRALSPNATNVPDGYKGANFSAFSKLNLTPRLLAKLLTNSYLDSVPPVNKSYLGFNGPLDPGYNMKNITRDPDFLSVNDHEWRYQIINAVGISDAMVPLGRSDLADRVWKYILSDQDAVDFLDGKPDPWGMRINPWYSTNDLINPNGLGAVYPVREFPKSDPVEKPDTTLTNPTGGSGAANLITWRPYVSDFETGAYKVLRGDANALGNWDGGANPPVWKKTAGSLPGEQRVIAVSTAAASYRYQNVTASLLNPAGNFVTPNRNSMTEAQAAMTPAVSNQNVRIFDFASVSAQSALGAYPLTMPIYAAINPSVLDSSLRAPYANLIKFAVTQGQNPGTDLGQLPLGYSPLSEGNVGQALQVVSLVAQGLTTIPTTIPTVVPSSSPSVTPPEPSLSPTSDISGDGTQLVLGQPTPKDPPLGPLAASVPFGFAAGSLLSLLYARLNRKKTK
jgi:hypothetical protein